MRGLSQVRSPQPFWLDTNIASAFPVPGTRITDAFNYGESLWGKKAKIVVQLPTGEIDNYFLKV
jgi:protein-ribulosamine 3-kinase